jgi:protease-4
MQAFTRLISMARGYNFLEMSLQGEVPEEEEGFIVPFLPRRRKLTVWDLERLFLYASGSPNILGALIKMRDLRIGLARAEVIRRGILDLRERGKKVFVYTESPHNIEYMIGSAADRVFVPPWAILSVIGLSAEVTFFKDALDKLGIEAEIKGLGEYKSAAETFTRNTMSESHRAMMDSIIDDLYSQFVKCVSQGRGIEEENLRALIDSGPFTAEEAYSKGLVDGLCYESDLDGIIEDTLDLKIRKIGAQSLLRIIGLKEAVRSVRERIRGDSSVIALVCDSGIITLGESKGSGGSVKTLGSQTVIGTLKRLSEDRRVKAIVLRILSPGGSGLASDMIRYQIRTVSEKKPVVISISDVAASGGYMIALGARSIVADSLSLTGSIGIISGKFNLSGFIEKLGIKKEWVTRGKRALVFSSFRGFTKREEERLGVIMRYLYDDFVKKVADVRAKDFESAEQLARGRVWTGRQAKELGLIDELGGIREAIRIAKREAGIPDGVSPVIRFFSKPRVIQLAPFGRGFAWGEDEILRTLERERALALMPFWIDVK